MFDRPFLGSPFTEQMLPRENCVASHCFCQIFRTLSTFICMDFHIGTLRGSLIALSALQMIRFKLGSNCRNLFGFISWYFFFKLAEPLILVFPIGLNIFSVIYIYWKKPVPPLTRKGVLFKDFNFNLKPFFLILFFGPVLNPRIHSTSRITKSFLEKPYRLRFLSHPSLHFRVT